MDPLVLAFLSGMFTVLAWKHWFPTGPDAELRAWVEAKREDLRDLHNKNEVLHRRLRIDHERQQRINNQLSGRPFTLGQPDDPVNLVANMQGSITRMLEESERLLDGQDLGQ